MASARSRSTSKSDNLDQPALPGTATPRWRGPVERSITKRLMSEAGLEDIDGPAVALLRSTARAIDWCEKNGERHTQALHVARMSELLTKLRLEPSARGEGVTELDEFDRALAEFTSTSGGDGS